MSYILEALKKAEEARLSTKLSDRPRFLSSLEKPVRKPFTGLARAVVATALAGAAATGWWFSGKGAEIPLLQKAAATAPGTPVTSLRVGAAALTAPVGNNAALGVPPFSVQDHVVTPVIVAQPLPPIQNDAYSQPRGAVQPVNTLTLAMDLSGQKFVAKPSVLASLASGHKAASRLLNEAHATAGAESVGLTSSRGSRVFQLEELPPEVRHDVPKMRATGYVYSAETGVRIVNINDRILQEGDHVMAGLKLEQIASDHVLFSFRGYRFRVDMF
jgi:general secretion pathway protein B